MYSPEIAAQIKKGRSRFIAMAITYFLGAFNDNFFKQAAMLLAVVAGLSGLQGTATMLFSLPFILFSAHAGWLADRFSKKNVVVGAKFLELGAMLVGAYGIITLNWPCILAMVFIMAAQSTLFGPAINGSIPELYPREYVTTANAVLKLVTTLAILAGIGLAGVALDQDWFATAIPFGRLLVALFVLLVAGIGVMVSFGVVKRPAAGARASFPWLGPLHSLADLYKVRGDRLLLTAIAGDAFFYFISSIVVLVINVLGISELDLSQTMTSLLVVSLMVGVCGGSFLAAKIASGPGWHKVMGPAVLVMGTGLAATWAAILLGPESMHLALIVMALVVAGCGGGLFLIPLASFIQLRPAADQKGKIIAVSNFTAFSGIFLSGTCFEFLNEALAPSTAMLVLGVAAAGASMFFSFAFTRYGTEESPC
ncbi:MAG: MFS transporter [Proteobacteria bacterium]|nr:MFS transporter [Pseudomonadota bacterium]MBU1641711.1 MFS transporter [Pseudomonadota bacterium]